MRAVLEMDVETLLGDIDLAIGEPTVEVKIVRAQNGLGKGVPGHALGLASPIADRVLEGVLEGRLVGGEATSESR